MIHCKLVVGSCQLSTVLQIVEEVDFPDHSLLSKWHIHVGSKDFEALQHMAWDADICYLAADPELGEGASMNIAASYFRQSCMCCSAVLLCETYCF